MANPSGSSPLLAAVDGGRSLSADQADREEVAFWAELARACENALSQMHAQHPQRGEFSALAAAYWTAAGQPARLRPASVG